MASLIHMQKILSNRMQYFSSLEKAVPRTLVNFYLPYFLYFYLHFEVIMVDLMKFPLHVMHYCEIT